jgi:predicted permease
MRSLRRARRHTGGIVAMLAIGGGAGYPLVAAARAGLAWAPVSDAPAFGRTADGGAGGWTDAFRGVTALQLDGIHAILFVVLAAGLLVLAATCVNAGALVLARASTRRYERALRAALGAGPGRLLAHAVAEGAFPAAAGAALALAIGTAVLAAMRRAWLTAHDILAGAPDLVSLALGVGVPAAVVVAFTAAPALRAGRGNLHAHLTVGERATPGRYDAWFRRALSVLQFTASMGLLVGAGVLIRGTRPSAANDNVGFDPRDTLTLRVDLGGQASTLRSRALDAALARVRAVPGVRAAALGSPDAWFGLGPQDVATSYCPECSLGMLVTPVLTGSVRNVAVSPGWFDTLGIPLVAGRAPGAEDAGSRVVVINQALAGQLFPNGDPLGKRMSLVKGGPRYTVVGIAGDVAPRGPGTPYDRASVLYLPARFHPPSSVGVAVRAGGGNPRALGPSVASALRAALPGARVREVMTMEERLWRYAGPLRWFAAVLAGVAAAALLLCSAGVYGVVAYGVARRTREIGVRMALGARAGQVVMHVIGGGLRIARLGTILGAMAAFATAQSLSMLFRGVPIADAPTWVIVPLLLAAVTVAASWIPARRAARIEPLAALRGD